MINLLELCADANTIGISGHIQPDGDCVGSTMALWQFLTKVYPEKTIEVRIDKPPATFHYMKGVSNIVYPKSVDEIETIYDVFILADTVAEPDRIGNAYPYFHSAKKTINIDHHITNSGSGDYNYIDATASSASELVYDLIAFADPEGKYMDEELAQTIYSGIIQDCGVFQYSNTSPKTLNIAAKLIAYGFDFATLIEETFYEKTFVQNKLLGLALDNCALTPDGILCYTIVDRKELESVGGADDDFEGIVNQLRHTKGAEVAALIKQTAKGNYKVSLRSGNLIDVSKVAAGLKGGGHKKAAGCTIDGNHDELVEIIWNEIKKQM